MNIQTWPISRLKNWDKNPRAIKEEDYKRLKRQLQKLGQYKPLVVMEDGTVLGGNMRLRAYRDLGIAEIVVSIVSPKNEMQKTEYALSDNDNAGFYQEEALGELIVDLPELDLSDYKVDLSTNTALEDVIGRLSPPEGNERKPLPEREITCPECQCIFNLKQ